MQNRVTRGVLVSAGSLALMLVTPGQVALAEAGSNASCMGHEASGVSPPGSSSEALGGMRELTQFIGSLAGPPGATYAFIASLHEGSHEACDEALE
jgi:hypothetical protein